MTDVVWLVRHAATAWTGIRWSGGRSDPPLTPEGQRIARALAERLGPQLRIASVVSSPLFRATSTAAPIADRLGCPVETDADLREVDVGDVDGLTFDAAAARFPALAERLLAADPEIDWPSGERARDLRHRIARGWRRVAERHAPAVVVVTHGGVIGEIVRVAVLSAASEARWLEAGGALELRRDGDRWVVGERVGPASPART